MSGDLSPCPLPGAPVIAGSSFGELSGLPIRVSEAVCRAAVAEIQGAVAVQCHQCRLWFGTRDGRRSFCTRQCRLAKAAKVKRAKRARRLRREVGQ